MNHLLAAASALALSSLSAAQDARGLTPEDVMRMRSVTAVLPHPTQEGTYAFTRTEPRPPEEVGGSRNHLWLGEGESQRLLIGGKKSVRGAAWHPNGTEITFVDRRDDAPHNEVYALAVADGAVRRVTETPHGVSSYAWRPDGKAMAFTITDQRSESSAAAYARGFRQRIVDEDYRHTSLWLWEEGASECRRLTEGVTVNSFEWAPTGEHLAAGIAPSSLVDDRYMFTRLHLVDPQSGDVELLVENPGKLGDYVWSSDGQTLFYVSAADRNDPHAGTLFRVRIDQREPTCLTPDIRGMVQDIEWLPDQNSLGALVSRGVRTMLSAIDPETGAIHDAGERQPALAITSWTHVGDTIYAVGSTRDAPPEAWRISATDMGATRLTDSNPWLADVELGEQKVVRFAARDGLVIEGLLMYPVGYAEGQRYPMVIIAHGGPESHFSDGWNTSYGRWGQMLCARGNFAWLPNYRASTGYGVEFAKADHGDPMGSEFEDHLDAIAHFEGAGLIDGKRVGIGGGSYGGYTAAWAATRHSEHFAAAVSFVPFVDIRTKWYTSDIPWEFFFVHYQEKWPHEQPGFLADRSPLSYAHLCRTPLLLLGGTSDPRVHPSQPFMLYRAVKFGTETPVRYVQYPGEGHGNGSNVYRYDYALRTLRWFDHYLSAERTAAMPPFELDYSAWAPAQAEAEAEAGSKERDL